MYGEGRIAGVIEIFKRGFSFCERTGAFSLIKTKELLVAEGAIHADMIQIFKKELQSYRICDDWSFSFFERHCIYKIYTMWTNCKNMPPW